MPYKKRYYGRRYGNKDKYSIETSAGTINTGTDGDANVLVVPAANIEGMRKIKHITIQMAAAASSTGNGNVLYWGLVYVPEGYDPNTLTVTGQSLYEPNQFLMSAGVFDFDAGPCRIHSPISRNLNSGDRIFLIVKGQAQGFSFQYMVRYAMTLQ